MTLLMEPKDAAQLTCLRVVDGYELQGLTQRGWRVVETIITSEPIDIFVPMSEADRQARGHYPNSGGTYYDGQGQVPNGMLRSKALGQICKYLIGQPMESALDLLVSQLEDAKALRAAAEAATAEAAKATKKAEEDLGRMTKSHEVCSADRDRHQKTVYELQEQKRKLEVDIGKLRIALGDLRMKEILGGTAK